MAQVDFGRWGRFDVPVPPLPPGGGSRGHATIPLQDIQLGDQMSSFQIIVDPGNAISETNKGNNKARSYCRNAIIRNIPGR